VKQRIMVIGIAYGGKVGRYIRTPRAVQPRKEQAASEPLSLVQHGGSSGAVRTAEVVG